MKFYGGMQVACTRGKVKLVGRNGCHKNIWIAKKGKKTLLILESEITAIKNEFGYQNILTS